MSIAKNSDLDTFTKFLNRHNQNYLISKELDETFSVQVEDWTEIWSFKENGEFKQLYILECLSNYIV